MVERGVVWYTFRRLKATEIRGLLRSQTGEAKGKIFGNYVARRGA
jgi:hypothetical protein